MQRSWEAVQLFLAAAEKKSLARAAKVLGVTQPTVSRRLAELEAVIGEALFVRSVEGVVLTPAGERLLPAARLMAEGHGEWSRLAAAPAGEPVGVVQVSAPPGIASESLVPFAAKLRKRLPGVRLSVNATVRHVDLVRGEADLALRATRPASRELLTLASLEEPVGAFASPAYVKSLPPRPTLADVAWVAWPASHAELPPNPQLARRVPDFVPVFASDDFLVQLRAAEQGLGGIILSSRTVRGTDSKLVPLPVSLGPMKVGLHLVCARSALSVPRIRAVAELLSAELAPSQRVERGR